MKERELRTHATCTNCGNKIGAAMLPMFVKVTIEEFVLDPAACGRQHGLGMMIGAPLAMLMGPDEDLAKPLGKPVVATLCANCRMEEVNVVNLAAQVMRPASAEEEKPEDCQDGDPDSMGKL